MLELTRQCIVNHKENFEKAGVRLPRFDLDEVRKATFERPVWVHFSVGNLFKAFHACLAQRLIETGVSDRGIIAAEPFDYDAVTRIFPCHDNLFLRVVMKADGGLDKEVVASVTEALAADSSGGDWARLREIFRSPTLQVVSLSITEKGYDLRTMDGAFRSEILKEFDAGPAAPGHAMTKLCALAYERWQAGGAPLALLSTDNFSHNGDRLREAVLTIAGEWKDRSQVEQGFIDYIRDESMVSFPLSMIDKITPYPSERVRESLTAAGLTGLEAIKTSKGATVTPFVNTEEAEYLVIEDRFPNGRPALEKAGVYFTSREIVDQVERMKVCTCLNPLHTALAIFGCLLGYTSIADEMKDRDLARLVRRIGYDEGLPVVTDPGIINPGEFIAEVLEKRFPNPNIPDTPQRIATDTSQKLGIRFGETIKLYMENKSAGTEKLTLIPLVIAAWCRYLLAVDDTGAVFIPSPDPLLEGLKPILAGVTLGDPASAAGKLKPILSNENIFAVNLYDAGLGERIESYFAELIAGPGAVRKTLQKYL
ncbi:MAG: mannitol dehydrogenase family protein [Treponema sp.]|jgi:fructuronate reductase|nr:mannitol dehydrogenase family protein [Treponema sp.]